MLVLASASRSRRARLALAVTNLVTEGPQFKHDPAYVVKVDSVLVAQIVILPARESRREILPGNAFTTVAGGSRKPSREVAVLVSTAVDLGLEVKKLRQSHATVLCHREGTFTCPVHPRCMQRGNERNVAIYLYFLQKKTIINNNLRALKKKLRPFY